jgi:glycosyltransferase involved in cell wall biosynthesis
MGWFPDRPGGLNRYVRALVESVQARAVVLGPAEDAPPSVVVPAHYGQALPARLVLYARAAARLAREAEVVDAHLALYALLPVGFGRLRRRPLVVHFHGPWALEGASAGQSRLRTWLKRRIELAVYQRADEAVVLTRAFKRTLVEEYGVQPWRIDVIPPGVDLRRFSPGDPAAARNRLGVPADAWLAFAARRLVPRMGIDVLIRAWAGVAAEHPHAVLALAGDGPERASLESAAERLGLGPNVRFVGRVSDEQLRDWYRAADVSVVPSRDLEGFGLVALESLACGTPAIVTDAGGLPEAITLLDPGLVVPRDDADALAVRLRQAIEKTRPLPSPGRCRVHAERFSWETAAEEHRRVYRRAASGRTPERLRVVYVDHCARLSGAELALLRLLPALRTVDAHVILGEEGPLVDRLLEAGISAEVLPMDRAARDLPRHEVGTASSALAVLRSARYTLSLARRLRRLAPDIVHTNSLKAALYGGAAARLAGVPVVWHVRDRLADDYLPEHAIRLVHAAARRFPSSVIVNSNATRATLPDDVKATVVASPIPLPERPADRNGHPLRVGMVGRVAPWKGQHVFLEAFARAFPEGSERAVVVGAPLFGRAEEAYARDLGELAATLGVGERLEFRGFRDRVDEELARLDVLVHASVLPEPFGQVVVEGMAAGLPVVAVAAGSPAELLDDGVTGLLYPAGDVEALASALRRLAAEPDLRERLGRAAREQARAFAPEGIAEQVVQVYESVIA